jgi:hypothetical protein
MELGPGKLGIGYESKHVPAELWQSHATLQADSRNLPKPDERRETAYRIWASPHNETFIPGVTGLRVLI